MEKKLTKRQQQAMETKSKIIKCAFKLFEERNYDSITIADIRQEAGVSVGSFYHYFSSKEELLLSVYNDHFDRWIKDQFLGFQFANNTDAIVALLKLSTHIIDYTCCPYYLQARLSLHGDEAVQDKHYFPRYLHQLVDEAIAYGEIHPSRKTDEVTAMLLQTSRGIIYDWAVHNGGFSAEEQVEKTVRLLLTALQQPG